MLDFKFVKSFSGAKEPLHDWSLWEQYRSEVKHPVLTIQPEDIQRAKGNIQSFEWAKNYLNNKVKQANYFIDLIATHSLERLIELTTPGDPLWTPCPSCREKDLPFHPHGQWNWKIESPDEIVCDVCHESFPHSDYPESIELKTSYGLPQTIAFYGGDTFKIFGFPEGRPSFTANIRSRKVQWCAGACRTIAEAYILTGDIAYAVQCKAILSRMAECYPNWLIHVGYGEYADMDPREAAQNIMNLPNPELTPPPNHPDNRLWTGYWSAGRASGVGLEADFVRKMVESYDLTCEAVDGNQNPLYSQAERITIEKDLLLESTILLVCDKKINNKAVSNRSAVGMVGICLGHPELMRFGLDGFDKTVNGWFLKDGTTKETPFYGLMTLGGLWDFAQSVRGYSDPKNYRDASGNRLQGLNLYRDPGFTKVWSGFFKGLQGDLKYPPFADSFLNNTLDPSYVELMVANYEDHPEYLALLRELCGEGLTQPSGPVPDRYYEKDMKDLDLITLQLPYDLAKPQSLSSFSLYYRDGSWLNRPIEALSFPDWNPDQLRIPHLRTGQNGRESLLMLNASHWNGHNHEDSLNLYYWKNNRPILSDFGYLWDHPHEEMTTRTLAHNTVLIDQKSQVTKRRGGSVKEYHSSSHVKMVEAESDAYAEASMYRRTSAIIDHGQGRNYVVDFFRVRGGDVQDYIFHIESLEYAFSEQHRWSDHSQGLYDFESVKKGSDSTPWQLSWPTGGGHSAKAWMLAQAGETAYIAEGWGQKDWENSDYGAKASYIVRRSSGSDMKTFVSVFEGSSSDEFFVKKVDYDEEQNLLIIETSLGRDYVMSAVDKAEVSISKGLDSVKIKGHFAVSSVNQKGKDWDFVVD
ncbi:hypothetical protein GCM10025777_22990 [Membranihabitans marinus]